MTVVISSLRGLREVLLSTRQGLLNGRLLQASLIIIGMHCTWLFYSFLTPLPVRIWIKDRACAPPALNPFSGPSKSILA